MVKKYLDVDLSAVYTTMESQELDGLILTEEEKYLLNEKNIFSKGYDKIKNTKDKAMDKMFGAKKGGSKPREKGSRTGARMDKNSGKQDFQTKRMGKDGLESNRLVKMLNLVGSSLGGLSWLTNTEWFEDLFKETYEYKDVENVGETLKTKVSDTVGSINPGEGMTQILSRVIEGVDLKPGSSPEELIEALKKVGGGDLGEGINSITSEGGIFKTPDDAKEVLSSIAKNPNSYGSNLGEIFQGEWEGTGKSAGDKLVTVSGGNLTKIITKVIYKTVVKGVVKTGVKTGGGLMVAKGLGALLGPLGIGLVASGVLVKLLREKGQRQSRAKTLNDLLQMLQDVKPTGENKPVITSDTDGEVDSTDDGDVVDSTFLKGNRNMQLGFLSKTFVPNGFDIWSLLSLKEGTVLPSGFFDATLGQGKFKDDETRKKYLLKFYKHLNKNNEFSSETSEGEWVKKIKDEKTQSMVRWIRNTRKNIGKFFTALSKKFPDFEIGERAKATVSKPGKRGESMGTAGVEESLKYKNGLITESSLGNLASKAGFDDNLFMKNLPEFMEMLSMMYYGAKGKKLPYNKEAVYGVCGDYGCKSGNKKYKKTKSDDYNLMSTNENKTNDKVLLEELKRIQSLM